MRIVRLWVIGAAALAVGACGDDTQSGFRPQRDPALGATSFVSAARSVGSDFRGPGAEVPTDDANGGDGRTIEEGDIYRVLGPDRILNLNSYRGLQVIDTSDPEHPAVIGGLRLSGSPVELYVVGERALVLLNDWYGYWGSRFGPEVGKEQGGAIVLVDLGDPRAPVVKDRVVIAGSIMKSRLARGDTTTLYVAAAMWQLYDGGGLGQPGSAGPSGGSGMAVPTGSSERTIVASFDIGTSTLAKRGELDLGGWVADIHATSNALLVARTDWNQTGPRSRVAMIDISDPSGTLVEGPDIAVAGQVKSQFNLDLRGDILRVVSEAFWGDALGNHLQTFDVSDMTNPVAVDDVTFGAGESLFATLFVGPDKAFFVTYLRQDPFHAFHISPTGEATEMSQFVVSGWNDFFASVLGDTRLVGIGVDDAGGGRALAVSLYDIHDLQNPNPLVARADTELAWSWSEASWDHRAFSVLEDAVDVTAPDGTVEHGLVLLPYAGWADDAYRSGVQLFTFSPTTMTRRGTLAHEEPVRRGFLLSDDVAACLSDTALGLYDVGDPDVPAELGTVALAPAYQSFLVYGEYGLRYVDTATWSWWGSGHNPPPGKAEIVVLTADPDTAPTLTTFEVPAGASLTKVGDLAVAMTSTWQSDTTNPKGGAWWTTVTTWDLSHPLAPAYRGTLLTSALPPAWGGYGWGLPVADACFDCWGSRAAPRGTVVGDALVFLEGITESEPSGERTYCTTRPPGGGGVVEPAEPIGDATGVPAEELEVWYSGSIECVRDDGGPETCYGAIYACSGLDVACVEVADPETIGATTECVTQPTLRYWTRWVLHVLDMTNAAEPTVTTPLELPNDEAGIGMVVNGTTLWVTTNQALEVEGDARAYVRYWARAIDLARPSEPVIGARINVPGNIVAVSAENDEIFTVDDVYADDHVESAISRCTVHDGVATLVARHRVADRQVQATRLDGAGHVLVAHGPIYWWYGPGVGAVDATTVNRAASEDTWQTKLTLLDAEHLDVLATVPIDTWAELGWAGIGRAVFQVPGGVLVMNTEDAEHPTPQAWFATMGWPSELLVAGDKVYFAAGRFGIYRFDLDTFNLMPAP